MTDKFEELCTERARQDDELEAFSHALRRLDALDVPPSFYEDLDTACTHVEAPLASMGIPLGLRA